MLDWIADPHAWLALITLTGLEIVLGIDNIIVLTILVDKLPKQQQNMGRLLGLGFAMATRILLLVSLVWLTHLITPLFTVMSKSFSARDLILIFGGLFLMAKSTQEIHHSFEGYEDSITPVDNSSKQARLMSVILQIGIIDIVFSLDSVITAVGLANDISIMIIAIMIAIFVMMFAAKVIGDFVNKYPTLKMLALSFLILVGFVLVGEGMGLNVPKGYIYFAMIYSLSIEFLNIMRQKRLKKKV